MSADEDLRLAWLAHRDGLPARRDALLTLAVASAGLGGDEWVERVRTFLVASRPGHLYSRPGPLDEAFSDPRVIDAIVRLRQSYPPARVQRLVERASVARGPYIGRPSAIGPMLDDLLAPPRKRKRRSREVIRLGTSGRSATIPIGALAPLGPVTPPAAGLDDSAAPTLAFYLSVLLGVAMLCAIALDDLRDGKRAA